ncbi:hypothetical protein PEPS_05220 [Persicobacter psychrovividus]|uniref:Uncharacterized protein n=2 Tax=Persicobacter psychrovividus TaxID=387638 RepID=A0ABM7VBY9_9BACT|nr:hypothetical protein PEPS_05220 [Persicobacter psychrovividus]
MEGSPVLDQGVDLAFKIKKDFLRKARVKGSAIDIGAIEGEEYITAFNDLSNSNTQWFISPQSEISWLSTAGSFSVMIFDQQGNEVFASSALEGQTHASGLNNFL